MPSTQVRATQLQDGTTPQLEALRARARELRLRTSDLQAREQQLRESRYPTPAGPDRERLDRQWLNARHEMTAATIELEGVNERISELRMQRDQAMRASVVAPAPAPEPPPVESPGLANAGIGLMILFLAPLVVLLVYRLFTRGRTPDPLGLEASPRFQRMEQAIESIAMEVEAIAEAQRFTTRILAERHQDSPPRAQAALLQRSESITPR